MDHHEFRIGLEFWTAEGRRWRCTDVGSRVVVAIRVDETTIATSRDGVVTHRILTGEEAQARGCFNGPPYGVLESVFDEYEMEGCQLAPPAPDPS